MFIKAVIQDFPQLSRYLFTYQVPESMQALIFFGSRILVPFGLNDEPRLGYIVEITESLPDLDYPKNIFSILSEKSELTKNEFRFLQFVSFYHFVPISTIMKFAGLFTKIMKPELHYEIQSFDTDLLKNFQNKERIKKFLNLHPDGFSDFQFRRYLKIKKNSTIPKKLIQKGILIKTWKMQRTQNLNRSNKEKAGRIYLQNGSNFDFRLKRYKEKISEEKSEHILFISPNVWNRQKAKKWFLENGISNIQFGSKLSVLDITIPYDLLIIDDCTNSEYQVDKPFSFDIEKVARIRSIELGTTILFGSYVPSLQSFRELSNGQIQHVTCLKKGEEHKVLFRKPFLIIRSLTQEIEKHGFSFIPFSIQKEMLRNCKTGRKSFILINRKGFFNLLICRDCGFSAKCDFCGIPLSYKPLSKKLVCKYCGFSIPEYDRCPKCRGVGMHFSVYGTEKIEKEAKRIFYPANVFRLDTTCIGSLSEEGINAPIVIGTSIALDILDFSKVDLCCFLGIDSLLNYPQYKAQEKVFHLIAEIFERMLSIENREKRIIIPSFTPFAEIFQSIQSRSIMQFYNRELSVRQMLKYPPFEEMIQIALESREKEILPEIINRLLRVLKTIDGLEIISTKPLLGTNPFGIYRSEITLRTSEILNLQDQLTVVIDEFRKNEKIKVLIRNME